MANKKGKSKKTAQVKPAISVLTAAINDERFKPGTLTGTFQWHAAPRGFVSNKSYDYELQLVDGRSVTSAQISQMLRLQAELLTDHQHEHPDNKVLYRNKSAIEKHFTNGGIAIIAEARNYRSGKRQLIGTSLLSIKPVVKPEEQMIKDGDTEFWYPHQEDTPKGNGISIEWVMANPGTKGARFLQKIIHTAINIGCHMQTQPDSSTIKWLKARVRDHNESVKNLFLSYGFNDRATGFNENRSSKYVKFLFDLSTNCPKPQ